MRPLPFVWPWGLLFWGVWLWAFLPEIRIVRRAGKAAAHADSPDAGSIKVIMWGGMIAALIAFPLAWTPLLRMAPAPRAVAYVAGVGLIIAASLLRRHCFRMLGTSFTGDVRAEPGQRIVTTGAYALLRHPSYTAGVLLNLGIGLALGSWASATLLTLAAFAVYAYRIAVEERTLLAVLGEPYREFMRTRRRLIPYLY